jgi:MFS family permease
MDGTDESLLRNPHFRRLWIGQGVSFVGDAVAMIALVVLVVQMSGNASAVGGLLVVRFLPTLASPLAGVLADRLDRRAVLVTNDLARAALTFGVIFAENLLTVYALVFFMGLSRAFFNPTIRAAFPSVVGGGDLTRANALVSATFSVSESVGPALGGLLVATVGVDAAFALDAVTYLISAVFLSRVPLPRPRREESAAFGEDLRAGIDYLAGARVPLALVVGAFLTMLTVNITIPAEVFLARETFGAGDFGYGLLVGLYGGGMVLGSALIGVLGERGRLLPFYFLSLSVSVLALVATSFAPTFVLALLALTVLGFANGVDNVATDTILQRQVPDYLLGRVFSVRFLGYGAGEALAYPVGGLLVDAAGVRLTYLSAGVATAVATLLVLLLVAANSKGGA